MHRNLVKRPGSQDSTEQSKVLAARLLTYSAWVYPSDPGLENPSGRDFTIPVQKGSNYCSSRGGGCG
jgi:hypothetical protein